jgi:hypothetical protein
MLASDERSQALLLRRLEPADNFGLAQHRPGGNRRVEALEGLSAERL